MSGIDLIEMAVRTNPIFHVVWLAGLFNQRAVGDREAFSFAIILGVGT
jgi:hypothetical protein